MSVALIIPTRNAAPHLDRLLPALAAQSLQPLPPEARARILELSEACPALLRRSIAVLRQAALPAPVAHGRAPLREAPRLPG